MPSQSSGLSDNANAANENSRLVAEVFDTVAYRYDLMNDLMSLGTHRVLKRIFCDSIGLRPGFRVLDIAGGTGDITQLIAKIVEADGNVTMLDANESMLRLGRDRLIDGGHADVQFVLGNAEAMPIPPDSFDAVTIAFGIRNIARKESALLECFRVLKPGGRLAILEFSTPKSRRLNALFRIYRRTWPLAGLFVVGNAQPYEYLVRSIDQHPSQEAMLSLLEVAGFKDLKFENLLGGIVAIHQGTR